MLARARQAGVAHLLAIGVDVATSIAAAALAARYPDLRAAIGIHPTRAARVEHGAALAELDRLAQDPLVVAVGEVGLDAASDAPLDQQARLFELQLDLAERHDLALNLHVVGHDLEAQRLLAARPAALRQRAVVHYFQGDLALARSYLDLGCSISLGKPVTLPANAALRAALVSIPLDRLLLETDTYPLPGRSTEPRDVRLVAQSIADLKHLPFEAIARATTANYLRLYT
jgi:TatD DNase family protein